MKKLKKLAAAIVILSLSPLCMAQRCNRTANPVVLTDDEVPVFITIGQSNADGSAFADAGEDRRLSAWYDNPDSNPGLMKIWYRSCYIVNQSDGARWVFDGTTEDVAPGWLNLYYKNDNLNGRTMMNMIHGYGTWSAGAAGRRWKVSSACISSKLFPARSFTLLNWDVRDLKLKLGHLLPTAITGIISMRTFTSPPSAIC